MKPQSADAEITVQQNQNIGDLHFFNLNPLKGLTQQKKPQKHCWRGKRCANTDIIKTESTHRHVVRRRSSNIPTPLRAGRSCGDAAEFLLLAAPVLVSGSEEQHPSLICSVTTLTFPNLLSYLISYCHILFSPDTLEQLLLTEVIA